MTMRASHSGFTLIEMIVSVGLFAVVMLVATSAYLSLISLDRKARATNDLVTNLNFAVDTMERTVRSGSNFQSGGVGGTNSPSSGDTAFAFVNDQGQTVTYLFDTVHHSIGECINIVCNTNTDQALTDPRITITNMKFYVRGVGTTAPNDVIQPWVTFNVTGSLTPDSNSSPVTFTIQSTASARAIDL